jgi:hypothetical protein
MHTSLVANVEHLAKQLGDAFACGSQLERVNTHSHSHTRAATHLCASVVGTARLLAHGAEHVGVETVHFDAHARHGSIDVRQRLLGREEVVDVRHTVKVRRV